MPFEFKSPIHGMKINRLIFQTVGVLDLQLLPACQLSAVHLSLDLLDLLSVLLQQEVFLAFQLFLQFLFQSILSLYDLLSAPFIVLFCLNVEVLLSEFEEVFNAGFFSMQELLAGHLLLVPFFFKSLYSLLEPLVIAGFFFAAVLVALASELRLSCLSHQVGGFSHDFRLGVPTAVLCFLFDLVFKFLVFRSDSASKFFNLVSVLAEEAL